MAHTRERRPLVEAPTRTGEVPTSVQPTDEQWSQLCQWHYDLGLIEGYARGRADADADLVAAMARALGRPDNDDYREAVLAHERMSEQARRRREWDAHAAEPRPGDYPGRRTAE